MKPKSMEKIWVVETDILLGKSMSYIVCFSYGEASAVKAQVYPKIATIRAYKLVTKDTEEVSK